MTAHRVREQTLAFAITKIIAAIGRAGAAAAVGKSEKLVYNWSDPDGDARPNGDQMLALDAAWLAAGGDGTAPIAEWYLAELERRCLVQRAPHSPLERIADGVTDMGVHHMNALIADMNLPKQPPEQLSKGAKPKLRSVK
jgi:hypothetical protein